MVTERSERMKLAPITSLLGLLGTSCACSATSFRVSKTPSEIKLKWLDDQELDGEKSLGQKKDKPLVMLSPGDQDVEGNFCAPLSSLPAIKALTHDVMMNEIKECWGPVEQSAAVSNVSKLGCMSCSAVPQALLDKQDISFFC